MSDGIGLWDRLSETFDLLASRSSRVRAKHAFADVVLGTLCCYVALLLRVPLQDYLSALPLLTLCIPFVILVQVITFSLTGVYDVIWRYISIAEIVKISKASFLAAFISFGIGLFPVANQLPHSTFLISGLLFSVLAISARVFRRYLHEYPASVKVRTTGNPTVIYGAGTNGMLLASRLQNDPHLGYQPIAFLDDDPLKAGRVVLGLPVMGGREELPSLLEKSMVKEVIVAVGHPSGTLLQSIVQNCLNVGIRPRLIKVRDNRISPGSSLDLLKDVELEDLLSRPKREVDLRSFQDFVFDKCVLVTGAGGSIGSELARQIYANGARRLILLDHSEFNLYEIDKELRLNASDKRVVPALVDIKNRKSLEGIFDEHKPDIVFHAAAYKHVHLVEGNPFSAILNNVLGTKNLIDLAEERDVKSFILISSDKAVNPAGVMGATKRVCELLVTAAGLKTGRQFASVRFGNVLGSSGSLVPLLREQVRQGKPITVTHPEMKRFFMLIPEAVSLVLRSSMLASPGDIMVLKMGTSVRIVDIAKSVILLSGKTEADIPIIFTGVRPGEKLEEELYLTGGEDSTSDPDILVVRRGDMMCTDELLSRLETYVANMLWEAHHSRVSALDRLKLLSQKHLPIPNEREFDSVPIESFLGMRRGNSGDFAKAFV